MKSKKRIGLALGSGGWRGLAHIGVIKSLSKHGYRISAIAGSSAGALIGGLYSLYGDYLEIENIFQNLKFKDLLYVFSDPSGSYGLIKGNKTLSLLQRYCQNALIENLKIPYKAVATDLMMGEQYIFEEGDLAQAIRASSSIPIIFDPVKFDSRYLVDGALVNPLPIDVVKSMNVDVIIAVNIYNCIFPVLKPNVKFKSLGVAMLSYQCMLNKYALILGEGADILVQPSLENSFSDPFLQFINNSKAIDQGETAMDAYISTLERLIY